jgi:hypothetical protein
MKLIQNLNGERKEINTKLEWRKKWNKCKTWMEKERKLIQNLNGERNEINTKLEWRKKWN